MHIFLYLKHFPFNGQDIYVGTSKAVHGLAGGLVDSGARVSVLCEGSENSTYRSPHGYEIHCFRNTGPYRSFNISPQLEEYLRENAAQGSVLAIANGMFNLSAYGFSRVARRLGIPYVFAPHGCYDPLLFKRNPHLKWPYWYLFERPLLRQALAVQVLDSRHQEWTQRRGVSTPALEVPNGFAAADCCPMESLSWRHEGRVRLLYWGRMNMYQKGLDMLLHAFARLAKTHLLELTLQGPDWQGEKRQIMALASHLQLDASVRFVEPDFKTPPPRVMADYDLVCMPSRYEGFGLSAMEAMLAGRPVLVTEPTGIAPHVRRAGCGAIVAPQIEGVVKGLRDLLERRDQWAEMGRKGGSYVLNSLNWNVIAGRALREYTRLLGSRYGTSH